MAPVAPVIATMSLCGFTHRSITPEKRKGHRLRDAPNLRVDPAPPAHGTCRVFRSARASRIASGVPVKSLAFLQVRATNGDRTVMWITEVREGAELES